MGLMIDKKSFRMLFTAVFNKAIKVRTEIKSNLFNVKGINIQIFFMKRFSGETSWEFDTIINTSDGEPITPSEAKVDTYIFLYKIEFWDSASYHLPHNLETAITCAWNKLQVHNTPLPEEYVYLNTGP